MSSRKAPEVPTSPADRARALDEACAVGNSLLETGELGSLEPRTIQELMRLAVKLYVAKRESGADFDPVAEGDLNATEVSATATGLLKSVRLEPFELSWWRRFGQL